MFLFIKIVFIHKNCIKCINHKGIPKKDRERFRNQNFEINGKERAKKKMKERREKEENLNLNVFDFSLNGKRDDTISANSIKNFLPNFGHILPNSEENRTNCVSDSLVVASRIERIRKLARKRIGEVPGLNEDLIEKVESAVFASTSSLCCYWFDDVDLHTFKPHLEESCYFFLLINEGF